MRARADATSATSRRLSLEDARDGSRRDDRRRATCKGLLDEGAARKAWIEGRQLVDLLEAFPATLSAEQVQALTRPLPPRAYSLASSRKEVGDEAHLLVAAVRYESHGARPQRRRLDLSLRTG